MLFLAVENCFLSALIMEIQVKLLTSTASFWALSSSSVHLREHIHGPTETHAYCTHKEDAHTHTHTDLLTSSVPVALLSEKQLELGDNLIDFILSFLDFTEAWRRHFNCAASPQSLNLPLISPRRHRCLRAVSGLLLIDVSACFMSFCDMTALTQCWFQSACHIPQRVTARESKKDKKKKKKELVGMSLA